MQFFRVSPCKEWQFIYYTEKSLEQYFTRCIRKGNIIEAFNNIKVKEV